MDEKIYEQRGERGMANKLEVKNSECRRFLDELEVTPAPGNRLESVEAVLEQMSSETRGHETVCADCRAALEDFVTTRQALAPLSTPVAEAGPWFATRVMASIRAQEAQHEEQRNGVWIGIRRLAPRFVALFALVLVLGTTWAYQVRQGELARRMELTPGESVFESVPAPLNDDVLIGAGERP